MKVRVSKQMSQKGNYDRDTNVPVYTPSLKLKFKFRFVPLDRGYPLKSARKILD